MRYDIRTEGANQVFDAEDEKDATRQAEDWLRDGDWDTSDGTIWVHGRLFALDETGERIDDNGESITVQIDPDEPDCTRPEGHDWQAPLAIVGGIKESPGVYGHGGGVTIQEVCVACGCGRLKDTWAQDPETGQQGLNSVKYDPGKYADVIEKEEDDDDA